MSVFITIDASPWYNDVFAGDTPLPPSDTWESNAGTVPCTENWTAVNTVSEETKRFFDQQAYFVPLAALKLWRLLHDDLLIPTPTLQSSKGIWHVHLSPRYIEA